MGTGIRIRLLLLRLRLLQPGRRAEAGAGRAEETLFGHMVGRVKQSVGNEVEGQGEDDQKPAILTFWSKISKEPLSLLWNLLVQVIQKDHVYIFQDEWDSDFEKRS